MAAEQKDEQGIFHGAFTAALLESVTQLSAGSAYSIFTTARAILKSNGRFQEPVIGGSRERQGEITVWHCYNRFAGLFIRSRVWGHRIQGPASGRICPGAPCSNELAMFNGQQDTICMLRVDTVTGVNQSEATVIKGTANWSKQAIPSG